MTAQEKNLIISLREAGCGYTTIAKKLNMPKSSISGFCQRNGFGGEVAGKGATVKPKKTRTVDSVSKALRTYRVSYVFRDSTDSASITSALEILGRKR